MRQTGRYESTTTMGEEVRAFVPYDLPPRAPPLELTSARRDLLRAALAALERLELAGEMIPSLDWFLYAFVRKEAVLSSQIEGTQATLIDLLSIEVEDAPVNADVEEVCNYVEALSYARRQLHDEHGLPISTRLCREIHRVLMRGVRGQTKQPGEVRRSQNWIGGTRPGNATFVPPPPHQLDTKLGALERYIHEPGDELHALIRIGLVHVQFETLHPFLDGNGRLGRLLISLLLEDFNLLSRPLLYLSLFLKQHRHLYYERLNGVRLRGEWEAWIDFFLEGVRVSAEEATRSARELFQCTNEDRARLLAADRVTIAMMRAFETLPEHPVLTAASLERRLEVSRPTATKCVQFFEDLGILVEATDRERDRIYHYERYLDILGQGDDLPA